jgi:hypothetical protein
MSFAAIVPLVIWFIVRYADTLVCLRLLRWPAIGRENNMKFYKFWINHSIYGETQHTRQADELKVVDGTTYWYAPTGLKFEVWGVEEVNTEEVVT